MYNQITSGRSVVRCFWIKAFCLVVAAIIFLGTALIPLSTWIYIYDMDMSKFRKEIKEYRKEIADFGMEVGGEVVSDKSELLEQFQKKIDSLFEVIIPLGIEWTALWLSIFFGGTKWLCGERPSATIVSGTLLEDWYYDKRKQPVVILDNVIIEDSSVVVAPESTFRSRLEKVKNMKKEKKNVTMLEYTKAKSNVITLQLMPGGNALYYKVRKLSLIYTKDTKETTYNFYAAKMLREVDGNKTDNWIFEKEVTRKQEIWPIIFTPKDGNITFLLAFDSGNDNTKNLMNLDRIFVKLDLTVYNERGYGRKQQVSVKLINRDGSYSS